LALVRGDPRCPPATGPAQGAGGWARGAGRPPGCPSPRHGPASLQGGLRHCPQARCSPAACGAGSAHPPSPARLPEAPVRDVRKPYTDEAVLRVSARLR